MCFWRKLDILKLAYLSYLMVVTGTDSTRTKDFTAVFISYPHKRNVTAPKDKRKKSHYLRIEK